MIPLAIPNMVGNEGKYLAKCIEDNFVSTVGPFVSEFENQLAKATDFQHAVVTSQGTTALHAGLVALGVDTNDLVIIPSLTFIATANSVAHCKAIPWLLDVAKDTWTLDPELLEQALEENCERSVDGITIYKATGQRVSAIMPVYAMGLAPDMDRICDIAEKWGIPVIADAAAALGTTYKGKPIGSTRAALTVMSFNGNKIITSGGGGALLSNDKALMDSVRHLTNTARKGPGYDHDVVGFNYRMTNIQAAVGVAQLENLEMFLTAKRTIGHRYAEAANDLETIAPFATAPWSEGNYWFSGIFLENWESEKIAKLSAYFKDNGVDARAFWKPIHLQKPYLHAPTNLTGVSDSIWERILPLPCSTQLTVDEQSHVLETLKNFLSEN